VNFLKENKTKETISLAFLFLSINNYNKSAAKNQIFDSLRS
jgi:hypothetical protein